MRQEMFGEIQHKHNKKFGPQEPYDSCFLIEEAYNQAIVEVLEIVRKHSDGISSQSRKRLSAKIAVLTEEVKGK